MKRTLCLLSFALLFAPPLLAAGPIYFAQLERYDDSDSRPLGQRESGQGGFSELQNPMDQFEGSLTHESGISVIPYLGAESFTTTADSVSYSNNYQMTDEFGIYYYYGAMIASADWGGLGLVAEQGNLWGSFFQVSGPNLDVFGYYSAWGVLWTQPGFYVAILKAYPDFAAYMNICRYGVLLGSEDQGFRFGLDMSLLNVGMPTAQERYGLDWNLTVGLQLGYVF